MSDYLSDKTGDVDPEVERLERALGQFAQASPPPPWPGSVRLEADDGRAALSASSRWMGVALLAASLALVIGGVTLAFRFRPAAPGWQVTTSSGRSLLAVGGWLETGDREHASFNVADIGQVILEPRTRLRLLTTRAGHHSLELARGTMHATIWAPPNQFFVETPSTLAVDLGCAYTLTVDDEGAGLVSVLVGWVGFKWHDRESFIPAGSACATRPRIGPGTPYNERVSPAYREALSTIDFRPDAPEAANALTLVLAESTERDEVTLWHLLSRVRPEDRDRVFDRLSAVVPPPPGVTREGVRAGNRQMLDAWWDGLGLGSTSLWRTWSQQWKDNSDRR
jgi:FecR protein